MSKVPLYVGLQSTVLGVSYERGTPVCVTPVASALRVSYERGTPVCGTPVQALVSCPSRKMPRP